MQHKPSPISHCNDPQSGGAKENERANECTSEQANKQGIDMSETKKGAFGPAFMRANKRTSRRSSDDESFAKCFVLQSNLTRDCFYLISITTLRSQLAIY